MRVSMKESAPAVPEAPKSTVMLVIPEKDTGARFADVLRGLGRELDRGEEEMKAIGALVGRSDLPPAALIGLQVGVYRYASAIDLASRFVDQVTDAVKTVLQANG